MTEETENKTPISAREYKERQTAVVKLPSGAVFRVKRRLAYGDYVELINLLAKLTGKPATTEVFDELAKDTENLFKMLEFTVPRMCLEPVVTLKGEGDYLAIGDMSFDDLIFISNLSLKVEDSETLKKINESFRPE